MESVNGANEAEELLSSFTKQTSIRQYVTFKLGMAYSQSPKKAGLPREVLKWLQSLDLSIFPKNVRRDFSNGYLVAEICSWYFPKDFQMHSYDNGASVAAKQSNWSQIEKFLVKQNISLLKEAIDGTIHCKPGAAELLVQEIYTFLTNRRIQTIQMVEQGFTDKAYQEQLPMVARATASVAIKSNLRLSEVIAEPNITVNQHKVLAIIQRHIEQRKEERNQDPSSVASGIRKKCIADIKDWQKKEMV